MGSSYRDDLNGGMAPGWEAKLRNALDLIRGVADELSECIGSDGQFDNAADDGALRNKLWEAMQIISDELPMTPEERAKKIELLKWQLTRLEAI